MSKEDLNRLREQLAEDPKTFITNEGFKLLSSVITVWRPDLKQELAVLVDELQALLKAEPPVAFNDVRLQKLSERYLDIINEITEEAKLRKKYIELMQKG